MNPKRTFPDASNLLPAFPSRDEIEHHLTRSRQLRAAATAAMLRSAGQALTHTFDHLLAPITRRPTPRTAPQ